MCLCARVAVCLCMRFACVSACVCGSTSACLCVLFAFDCVSSHIFVCVCPFAFGRIRSVCVCVCVCAFVWCGLPTQLLDGLFRLLSIESGILQQ